MVKRNHNAAFKLPKPLDGATAADIGRKFSVISSPKPRNIEASATRKAR